MIQSSHRKTITYGIITIICVNRPIQGPVFSHHKVKDLVKNMTGWSGPTKYLLYDYHFIFWFCEFVKFYPCPFYDSHVIFYFVSLWNSAHAHLAISYWWWSIVSPNMQKHLQICRNKINRFIHCYFFANICNQVV